MSETVSKLSVAGVERPVRTFTSRAFAASAPDQPLAPATVQRREPGLYDVQLEVLFCGVCHSDLHQARNEWQAHSPTVYPCVPGHEIVGRVTRVGSAVRKLREGDLGAVGCMVDSCRTCRSCQDGLEQFCEGPATFTYNSPDLQVGGVTHGGYSESIVVDEGFVLRLPGSLDPAGAAPLLCAGITTYSPMRRWMVRRGQKVGVLGLGGLGHMAVKMANALGARVVAITSSPAKVEDAERLGAAEVVLLKEPGALQKHHASFDYVLDTVSAPHDVNAYLDLLKRDATLTLVGAPPTAHPIRATSLIRGRRSLAGSLIGGIRETQSMLDFCGDRGITADIELIPIQRINEAYDRMVRGDIKNRFVIDMGSLKAA